MNFAIVRSPGHWVHIGEISHIDEREIVLINAKNLIRWTGINGLADLIDGPKGQLAFSKAVPLVRITNGPGVFIYQCNGGW